VKQAAGQRTAYVDVGGTNTRFVVGLRGVWTAAEKKRWKKKLAHLAPHIEIVSDIELAHRRAFGKKAGIVLNAGTGSIAFGRAGNRTARAGGTGPLLGDDGSAFWIGREYLRQTKKNDWRALRAVAVGKNPVAKTASFAVRALKDKKFKAVVERAQDDLVALVEDVAAQLRSKDVLPLAVQGGLFSSRRFRDGFRRKLSRSAFRRRVRFA
jgi:N-acetylglucosamine kinase-like BadF-type ATPase